MAMLINTVYILLRDLHYPVDMVVLEDAIKEWMMTLMKISVMEDFSTTNIYPAHNKLCVTVHIYVASMYNFYNLIT